MSANAIQCAARFSIWCESVQIRLRMPVSMSQALIVASIRLLTGRTGGSTPATHYPSFVQQQDPRPISE